MNAGFWIEALLTGPAQTRVAHLLLYLVSLSDKDEFYLTSRKELRVCEAREFYVYCLQSRLWPMKNLFAHSFNKKHKIFPEKIALTATICLTAYFFKLRIINYKGSSLGIE